LIAFAHAKDRCAMPTGELCIAHVPLLNMEAIWQKHVLATSARKKAPRGAPVLLY
jgi:hypothetical protein